MSSVRGWLTPWAGEMTTICRPIIIPLDDMGFYRAAISGAILELTHEWNWEQYGDITPAQAAERMQELYTAYIEIECTAGCLCTIPPAYDIDIGIELKVIRRGDGGFTEELVDGVWQTPTGDYEVPEPDARTESTSDERKCAAAANAINVIDLTYEEATDAYAALGTEAAIADAILSVIVTIMGLFGQATAASYISFGQSAFRTFFDIYGLITGDLWTSSFTNELECIFIEFATDTAGVITFDYPAIDARLLELQYEAGVDIDRQLLLTQVRYLFSIIAAGGINMAGGTTEIVSPNCDQCFPWALDFDFTTGAFSFTGNAYSGCTSGRTGAGWNACSNGSVWSMNVIRAVTSPTTSTHITKISGTFQPFGTGVNERAASFVYVQHLTGRRDTTVDNNPAINTAQTYDSGVIDLTRPTEFGIVWNGTGVGGLSWRTLHVEGYGPIPLP